MKYKLISDFIKKLSYELEIDPPKREEGGSGFIKNPVVKNIKPRPVEEIYQEDVEQGETQGPRSFRRPSDELVEHEFEKTDKPHVKPERGKPAPQKWDYKDTMTDYMRDYRRQNKDLDTGNRYIKRK